MRKFLAVLIILAGTYAGAAYFSGGQVRERYFSVLEEYERYGIISVSNHAYERGLLSSTAQTMVEVRIPGDLDDTGEDRVSRFVVRHVMRHGPLTGGEGGVFLVPGLARVESTIEPWVVGGTPSLFTRHPELARTTSELHVAFDGRVQGDVLIPAVDHSIDGEHVVWKGLTLRVQFDPASGSVSGELEMPGLVVRTGEGVIQFETVSSNFNLREVMPLVYAGHIDAGIAAMDITPADGDAIRVSGLRLTSDSSCDNSLYHYAQTIGVESVGVGDSAYGPAFCELTGKNIDADALSRFQTGLQDLYRSMADTESDLFYDRVGELYASLFAQVLAGTPEIHMPRLQVVTPMGEMNGSFSVRLTSPAQGAALNPLLLLQHLEAAAEVAVHEELLKGLLRISMGEDGATGSDELEILVQLRYNEQIEPLLAQNLIVRDGDVIRADAVFANGSLAVNGQAMPLF